MGKFSDQVEGFTELYKARLRAVAQTSVQDTISIAQKIQIKKGASSAAVAKAASTGGGGGRMRVDTGFLRASIQAGIGSMPSGPTRGKKRSAGQKGLIYPINSSVSGEPVPVTLLRWNLNETLFVGWTANYARPREAKDGFLRGAVEKWDQTVFKAVKKVERNFG